MRQAVDTHQPRRLQLRHAGFDALEYVAQALRGKGRGEFEGCELIGLVDRPQAVSRVDQEIGRVLDRAPVAGQRAQRVGDEGRQVERPAPKAGIAGAERLPADGA
ncbi:hypothetical protein, partial [Mesorhizobium sp.]|uniref:hypothetical protein n=1 Tax=Mesorhizobium sp. TaxID=1871066 RepID=UPI0025F76A2D